jgi:hypothetical protein
MCLCPVETLRLIMKERDRLRLQHSAVFFSWTFPHKPLDTAAFECCIRYCLVKAGIQAAPGSTRSVAASTALGEVLRLGDWTNASTYFPVLSRPLRYVPFFGVDPLISPCLN